ncbi:MAG: MlaC/ttg2D family ABC transporter substrate-binding protein [Desulfovibrio sp.]
MMKWSVLCVAMIITVLSCNVALAGEQTPTEAIKNAVDNIINVISDKKYNTMKDGADKRYADLESTVDKSFDFGDLSARSVGKPWLDFTPQQREAFIDAFSTLLKKTYIQKLGDYNGEKVDYLNEKVRGNRAMVLTQIEQNQKIIPVNYKLVKKNSWMVYDVIVEGVSLVKNYRVQFSKLLRNKSVEEVIEQIRERLQKLEEKSAEDNSQATFTDIS